MSTNPLLCFIHYWNKAKKEAEWSKGCWFGLLIFLLDSCSPLDVANTAPIVFVSEAHQRCVIVLCFYALGCRKRTSFDNFILPRTIVYEFINISIIVVCRLTQKFWKPLLVWFFCVNRTPFTLRPISSAPSSNFYLFKSLCERFA